MSNAIVYLNADDIRALQLSPALARESVTRTFGYHAKGLNQCLPKAALDLGPGHEFQSMAAASKADGIATIKWVWMVPVAAGSTQRGIHATICVNDYATGQPLAIMDGNEITLIRTAAMSAAAAKMVSGSPRTIGMIGCGSQAYAHFSAFADLFAGLQKLVAFSRSRDSAERLAAHAREAGLQADATDQAEQVLRQSDMVISMVPGTPGLKAFLDARLQKSDAFVSAVDIGRSWLPESFTSFDLRATDSLIQSGAPYDSLTRPVECARSTPTRSNCAQAGPLICRDASSSASADTGFAISRWRASCGGKTRRRAEPGSIGSERRATTIGRAAFKKQQA